MDDSKKPFVFSELKKFGIVALLDAAGTRNASVKETEAYVEAINLLKAEKLPDIIRTISIKEDVPDPSFRFFGDSILVTNHFVEGTRFVDYIVKVEIILNYLFPLAISAGIILRGALAIGEYLESESIVLGPAVTDAASWHDVIQLFGIITTPKTTNYLKSMLSAEEIELDEDHLLDGGMLLYDVPIKLTTQNIKPEALRTYILNWPACIEWQPGVADRLGSVKGRPPLLWYYDQIWRRSIPLGTDIKYHNTELFIKHSLSLTEQGDSSSTSSEKERRQGASGRKSEREENLK